MPNLIQKLVLLSFCLIELNSSCSTLFFPKGFVWQKRTNARSLPISDHLSALPPKNDQLMNHVGLVIPIESLCDCNLRKHFYFFFAGIVKLNISCPRSQDSTKWCSQWSIFAGDLVVVPCIHSHQQTHITVSKDSVDLACLLPREVLKVQHLSSSSVSKASINESCLFSNQGNIVNIC